MSWYGCAWGPGPASGGIAGLGGLTSTVCLFFPLPHLNSPLCHWLVFPRKSRPLYENASCPGGAQRWHSELLDSPLGSLLLEGGCPGAVQGHQSARAQRAWIWKEHSCDTLPKPAGSAVANLLIPRYFPCTDDSFGDMRQAKHWEGSEMELSRNMQCLLHSFLVSLAVIFQ